MYKFLVGLMFLVSVILFGWEMNRYAASGQEISTIPLQSPEGQISNVFLKAEMSPVRVILGVDYEINLQSGTNKAYDYVVNLTDQTGKSYAFEDRTQTDQLSDQGSSFENTKMNHIVGTFDIFADGVYEVNWKLSPKRAKINHSEIQLRRNVSDLNYAMMIGAGVFFVLGILMLVFRSKFGAR